MSTLEILLSGALFVALIYAHSECSWKKLWRKAAIEERAQVAALSEALREARHNTATVLLSRSEPIETPEEALEETPFDAWITEQIPNANAALFSDNWETYNGPLPVERRGAWMGGMK